MLVGSGGRGGGVLGAEDERVWFGCLVGTHPAPLAARGSLHQPVARTPVALWCILWVAVCMGAGVGHTTQTPRALTGATGGGPVYSLPTAAVWSPLPTRGGPGRQRRRTGI